MALDQRAPATRTTFDYRPLAALCVGWFIVIVDATIVNVALPSLGQQLRASVSDLQWAWRPVPPASWG
jgi:hypothetical protein